MYLNILHYSEFSGLVIEELIISVIAIKHNFVAILAKRKSLFFGGFISFPICKIACAIF